MARRTKPDDDKRKTGAPASPRGPIVVREPQRLAYLLTEIGVTDPDLGELPAAEAAKLHGSLWIVTAANPYSEQLDAEANRARQEILLQQLDEAGLAYFLAVGRSPGGQWAEESVAILGCGPRRATALGRTFQQNAVFKVTATEQLVVGCGSTWSRSRPYDQRWTPAPYSTQTLAEAVMDAMRADLRATFWRFRQPGWRVDGDTGLPCDTCGATVHLASALQQAKSGVWYDAKAIICPGCDTARLPSHLPHDLRRAVYAWSDWRLAVADAEEHPTKGDGRRCYVIALHDPTGKVLAPDKEWVYVGETAKDVEDRLHQQLIGERASRSVYRFGTELRADLMVGLPEHRTQAESKAYELYLGDRLRLLGFEVKGAH